MKNWNETLNEALTNHQTCHNLVELWTLGVNVAYGETVQIIVDDNGRERLISVYRNNQGRYETALTYYVDIEQTIWDWRD